MLKQLSTLVVFLSVLNLGKLQQFNGSVELIPFLTEVNDTIYQLSAQLEEQKNQLRDINDNIKNLPECTCGDSTPPPDESGLYTCGGTGGWRRAVYLDMTDPTSTCPSGWKLTSYSKRTCGRVSNDASVHTFDSTTFPVSGGYSSVCGRIKAYQWGQLEAFDNYNAGHVTTIDGSYGEGVSLTHGNPRQHIWSFVAGYSEISPTLYYFKNASCPCDTTINIRVPPFVGDDYFCESGTKEHSIPGIFYPDDPLWDGENCRPSSTCCSLNGPPYFVKQLPAPTTDDIEARILLGYLAFDEDIAVELVELYVK